MDPFDLICCGLEVLNLFAWTFDGVAYTRSAPNRAARRVARRAGEPAPPMDRWTIAFLIATPIVILLAILLIVKWTRRR
jgi:hypothetical protein